MIAAARGRGPRPGAGSAAAGRTRCPCGMRIGPGNMAVGGVAAGAVREQSRHVRGPHRAGSHRPRRQLGHRTDVDAGSDGAAAAGRRRWAAADQRRRRRSERAVAVHRGAGAARVSSWTRSGARSRCWSSTAPRSRWKTSQRKYKQKIGRIRSAMYEATSTMKRSRFVLHTSVPVLLLLCPLLSQQ